MWRRDDLHGGDRVLDITNDAPQYVYLFNIIQRQYSMKEIIVKDSDLSNAALEGMDEFLKVITDAIYKAIGGELNADNMGELNADQITLLAYIILRDSVMDGGFVELIHNGYGPFIYLNPFNKAVRNWGLRDLFKIISETHRLYSKYHEAIEKDCTQEEFDAPYEQYPAFADHDAVFVENDEQFTADIAHYVDEHLDNFCKIEQ